MLLTSRDQRITENEILTWEMQLKREGTLPPDVQRLLLENLTNRLVVGPEANLKESDRC